MANETVLMKGNEVIGEAAVRAGCRYFFGYPITPQNELPAYMAKRLPEVQGVFVQAESETAAINMVYGASGAGARVMTSSSSPGISLKQEGISYLAGAELPAVIVNMMRGGPGLGTIQPSQSDYFQATKGGGHGDYNMVVLAPASVQELADLTMDAFDIADKYRNPVMVLGDGVLGQMMEPVAFKERQSAEFVKDWATTGKQGRSKPNLINSLYLDPEKSAEHNEELHAKYMTMAKNEVRYEVKNLEDAEVVLVAYGMMARITSSVMNKAREKGMKVGLIRPISVWPFPDEAFEMALPQAKAFLTVEMSKGQMVEDVRLAVNGRAPVHFYGKTGGVIPSPQEVMEQLEAVYAKVQGGEA